jgi:chemotaxis protein methyltransferase CheR
VRDQDCVRFLQACLPRLGLKWAGYRKVRGTVCKRVGRRLRELGLADVAAYDRLLEHSPEELSRLDAFCRIPISRFYRDRAVFDALGRTLLPDLAARAAARGDRDVRCWSAGCASGEEVYSLRLLWDLALPPRHPDMRLTILGTDADEVMLRRAAAACYPRGSFKDAPADWLARAFAPDNDTLSLRPEFRRGIAFRREDIREMQPEGPFDLVLCRNLAFTYFAAGPQRRTFAAISHRLWPGGLLVLGAHERLPDGAGDFIRVRDTLPIWRKPGKEEGGPG